MISASGATPTKSNVSDSLPAATPAKPNLKPDTKEWEQAIKYLVDGGVISKIEAKYALSKVNKQLLMDKVLA